MFNDLNVKKSHTLSTGNNSTKDGWQYTCMYTGNSWTHLMWLKKTVFIQLQLWSYRTHKENLPGL